MNDGQDEVFCFFFLIPFCIILWLKGQCNPPLFFQNWDEKTCISSLFFFSWVVNEKLNQASGKVILLEIQEQERLYLYIRSQKHTKKQKQLLLQQNSREAKKLVFLVCLSQQVLCLFQKRKLFLEEGVKTKRFVFFVAKKLGNSLWGFWCSFSVSKLFHKQFWEVSLSRNETNLGLLFFLLLISWTLLQSEEVLLQKQKNALVSTLGLICSWVTLPFDTQNDATM